MNWKTTWLLLALAALLFGLIVLLEQYTRPPSPPGPLLAFPPAAVTNIALRRTNQFVLRAEKTGGAWNLTLPISYPAQSFAIESLLEALKSLSSFAYIPPEEFRSGQRSIAEYGLDVPAATLTLQHGGQRTELLFGTRTPVGDHIYLQLLNQPGLQVVDAELFDRLPRGANDWRDNLLINFSGLPFDRIEVRASGRGFALALNPTNRLFFLSKPNPARADAAKVDALLRKLAAARAEQFVSDDLRVDLELFGLHPPEAELVLGLGTNDLVTLQFGKSPTNDPTVVHVRRLSQTNIVLVSRSVLAALQTSYIELRDRRLMTFAPDGATEIVLVGAGGFSVRRGADGAWSLAEPYAGPADAGLVREWLDRLGRLEGSVEKDVVTDFAGYGLTPPARRFLVNTSVTNAAGAVTNMLLAQVDIAARNGERIFARRADENSVYSLSSADFDGLPSAAWQLRDRRVWSFTTNEVSRVSIRHNGYTRQLIRSPAGEWNFTAGGFVNSFAVEETLHQLGELRAAVWVAKGDGERARYGFTEDGHKLVIELSNGDKPRVLTLEFGGRAPSQFPYALATVDGESWIFEFPLKLSFEVARDLSNPPLRAPPADQ